MENWRRSILISDALDTRRGNAPAIGCRPGAGDNGGAMSIAHVVESNGLIGAVTGDGCGTGCRGAGATRALNNGVRRALNRATGRNERDADRRRGGGPRSAAINAQFGEDIEEAAKVKAA